MPRKFLRNSKYNIVVHESDLPKNKGFSPLYWQILRGKTKIVFTLFEVSNGVDNGNFYFKKMFIFKKTLLFNEIKNKQLECALILISKFIKGYKNKKLKTQRQTGKSTFLKKRTKNDSKIDLNKSLKSQINLLRISNNSYFPAFFNYENTRYEIFLKKTKK